MGFAHVHWHQGDECGCGCGGHGKQAPLPEEELRRWQEAPDDEIVCHCAEVDKQTIVSAIKNGAYTAPLVKVLTGIGRGRSCSHNNGCVEILGYLLKLYGQTTLSDVVLPLEEK